MTAPSNDPLIASKLKQLFNSTDSLPIDTGKVIDFFHSGQHAVRFDFGLLDLDFFYRPDSVEKIKTRCLNISRESIDCCESVLRLTVEPHAIQSLELNFEVIEKIISTLTSHWNGPYYTVKLTYLLNKDKMLNDLYQGGMVSGVLRFLITRKTSNGHKLVNSLTFVLPLAS